MDAAEHVTELPELPPRPADAHKGMFGHVLVVGGSLGMSGAAVLCGTAALRCGAGTVQIATPQCVHPIVAMLQPCATTASLPATADGQIAAHALPQLLELAEQADVLAVGPGLGRAAATGWLVRGLLEKTDQPLVLDADGLYALLPLPEEGAIRAAPTILTPHPGEFARLIGETTAEVQSNRESLAVSFAAERGVVLVLKGAGTIVTDGRKVFVNPTGNPGMATGGAGDVLTGLIAALLAQGLEPFGAAQLGAGLHGLAGDLARDDLGEESLMATDMLQYLAPALRLYRQRC